MSQGKCETCNCADMASTPSKSTVADKQSGLHMKYFVLKPHGTGPHAEASRAALFSYAAEIRHFNNVLADELAEWVTREHNAAKYAPIADETQSLHMCRYCGCIWRLWKGNKGWSPADANQRPDKCCVDSSDFISKLVPAPDNRFVPTQCLQRVVNAAEDIKQPITKQ